jgi:hypothetical protein
VLRWVAVALIVVAAVVVARSVFDGASSGSADCPTGRPTATIGTYSASLTAPPMPGDPSSTVVYDVQIDFEVTNEASAAIEVHQINAALIDDPSPSVYAAPSDTPVVESGETTTVGGSGQVVRQGTSGLATEPTPDSGSVTLVAQWADDDLGHCEI